ncbi:Mitochondrial sodium/hydrogen exchanger 9B2 [Orchesella cincta]|uniref:Mitochondrial sodium/hydrogen exchanger 9B2 n=1 Tax=Orchesella cincta TaxID=48709 RepID=A0A1D2NAQ6_ORCCI|nr:Mitochondrial sodium/hydrogen exchanger 9B2 [Orchesella cincta]
MSTPRLQHQSQLPSNTEFEADASHYEGSRAKGSRRSEVSEGPGLLEMVAGDEHEEGELKQNSSSIIKFYPDWCRCFDCNRHDILEEQSVLRRFFRCPPGGTFGRIILVTFISIFLWGVLYYLLKPLSENGPFQDLLFNPAWVEGPIFGLGVVESTGLFVGVLFKKFLNLPPLLGPLILGIIYNNVQQINLFHLMKGFAYRECYGIAACEDAAKHTINNWVKPIRIIALALILTRAGLELSPKQLIKLKGVVPLLAFMPCVIEATVCAITSFLFFNILEPNVDLKMGLAMCFVGGFALAAVSPAVVVPGALSLKKAGYGVVKGVPTLLIAASSIDDVLAISCYTIALGLAITTEGGQSWKSFTGGFIGLGLGIVHGGLAGMVLHFIPPQNSRYKPANRLLCLLLHNVVSALAYEEVFFNGAGSISVLIASFIAGFGWRSQPHWKYPMKKIEKTLAHMWVLWVPLIFGTIGKEIDLMSEGFRGVLLVKTFGVIFISLLFRCVTAFIVVSFSGFSCRERLFIALSWIPKATVQAALAPLVLTRAADSRNENEWRNATLVVNIAILAVLITAPLGSVLISFTGPRLLLKNTEPEITTFIESEFPNGEGVEPVEAESDLLRTQSQGRIAYRSMAEQGRLNPRFSSESEFTESPPPPV